MLRQLFGARRTDPKRAAEQLLRSAVAKLPRAEHVGEAGVWVVPGATQATYRPLAVLWPEEGGVDCVITANIVFDRDFLPRELLLQLLEANRADLPGRFWLMPWKGQRMVTLADFIPTGTVTGPELARRIERLNKRFGEVVQQLYALDLVLEGPEPFCHGHGA